MRIALLFEFGTLYGGERSMLAAVDRLSAGTIEFVFLAPGTGRLAEALKQRNIRHVPFNVRDDAGRRRPQEQVRDHLITVVRNVLPDLLHANSLSMSRLTGAVADRPAIPTVGHLRDILKLSRAAVADLNRNRLLIAVSEATKTFHVGQGLDAERTQVVYNGVDCEQFRPRPQTGWLKRELDLPDEPFLIATIGQIGLRKGQDVLAEAAARAAVRLPNTHYVLIGERESQKWESIEFECAVVRRFHNAGLNVVRSLRERNVNSRSELTTLGNRLHVLGYRDDVPRLLNEVDLLVHPAHQEPLGRVLLEAAASGTPIVATAVGGTGEILRDGESARLIPPNDPDALASAIIELYEDPAKRSQFAAAARRVVEERFTIDRTAGQMATLWRNIASI